MSAYREAADAPCHQCDRPAPATCTTCERATCDRHIDAHGMCGKCDEAYYRFMRSEGNQRITASVTVLMLVSAGLGMTVPVLLPVAIALPFVGLPAMHYLGKRRRRAKFFRTLRERGALPEPPDVVPDDHAEAERMVAKMEKALRKRK